METLEIHTLATARDPNGPLFFTQPAWPAAMLYEPRVTCNLSSSVPLISKQVGAVSRWIYMYKLSIRGQGHCIHICQVQAFSLLQSSYPDKEYIETFAVASFYPLQSLEMEDMPYFSLDTTANNLIQRDQPLSLEFL